MLLEMRSRRRVILKFILFIAAKKHKLAIAQTYVFLHASINKINCELLKLAQMHSSQHILLLA
jgi:hypothetical protein